MSEKSQLPSNLIQELSSDDSDERMWAVYNLESYENTAIISALIKAVQDEHRAVRGAASEILNGIEPNISTSELVPLLGSDRIEVRNLVASILTKYGSDAVNELIISLNNENEDIRKFAADILGLNGSDMAVDGLCKASLNDDVESVVVTAIEALGKIGSPVALDTLYEIVESKNTYQNEAIEAIGLIGDERSAKFLESQLGKGKTITHFAIIDALGHNGSESSIQTLKEFYLSDAPEVLAEPIVKSILKIGERKQIKIFDTDSNLLSDEFIKVIASSDESTHDLMTVQLSLGLSEPVIKSMFNHYISFSTPLLVSLVKAAEEYPSLINHVVELAKHSDEWVAYSSIESLENYSVELAGPHLIRLLKELDGMPVVAAIKSAISLQLDEAKPVIQYLTESENIDICETAIQALKAFK